MALGDDRTRHDRDGEAAPPQSGSESGRRSVLNRLTLNGHVVEEMPDGRLVDPVLLRVLTHHAPEDGTP